MVLFLDLDGTLLRISRRYYRIHRYICHQFGLVPLPFMTYWSLKRKADQSVESPGVSSPELRKECWENRPALLEQRRFLIYDTLLPEAKHTLEALARSHEVVLVTLRHNPENLHWQLSRLGLDGAFSAILTSAGRTGDGKQKLEMIRESLWYRPGEALIAGDTEAEVYAGKSLGIPTYSVTSGIRSPSFLRALSPTVIAPHIGGLPRYLQERARPN